MALVVGVDFVVAAAVFDLPRKQSLLEPEKKPRIFFVA